jgi:gamma-glutamylcyclotransferase
MPKYFAYGSNMSSTQLEERCPSIRFLFIAELRNFRVGFTRFSKKRNGGVADIVAAPGESVWGAVFEVDECDLTELDRFEGAQMSPPGYRRCEVQVWTAEGAEATVCTYEVVAKTTVDLSPSSEYHALIVRGAEHWGLPLEYCGKLKRIEVL